MTAAVAIAPTETEIELQVSFAVYTVAIISFVGWFAFVIFGGIGIIALPLDLIL